ncbi:hypothetical protein K4K59_011101 [Colletotrichum sp. SAR11_240]|nr:hypothetical protein K4K59_011101 [Colletotrichum sp. SAR11_240]
MDPVTIVTTTLGFIGTAIKSYNIIKEIKDLPEAFKEVERQLPLVESILIDLMKRLASCKTTDADEMMLADQILLCEKDAKTLNEIFEKLAEKCAEDQNDTKTWAKARAWYREALQGMKARQVESLLKKILGRVKLLALNELVGMNSHLDHITEAIDRLSKVDSSLGGSEPERGGICAQQTNGDSASGTQYIVSGGVVNTGSYSGLTFRDVQNLTLGKAPAN